MPSLSPTGVALVKSFEGFRAEPVSLPDGRWLIGHGHVMAAPPFQCTEAQAAEMLRADLEAIAAAINAHVLVSITQSQFDALCSFVFSIGVEAFAQSEVLRYLNAGQPIAAACALDSWRLSGATGQPIVLDALVRRRAVERSLFLYEGMRAPAPSALVRPQVDSAAAALARMHETERAVDETADKLRAILAMEPRTAAALQALPQLMETPKEPPPEPPPPVAQPSARKGDLIGHVALGGLGLLLIAMGFTGANDDRGVAHIVFTVPGVIAALMAAFYLLRSAAAD